MGVVGAVGLCELMYSKSFEVNPISFIIIYRFSRAVERKKDRKSGGRTAFEIE